MENLCHLVEQRTKYQKSGTFTMPMDSTSVCTTTVNKIIRLGKELENNTQVVYYCMHRVERWQQQIAMGASQQRRRESFLVYLKKKLG
jgi:alkyl hydroperoxide reductase subunit AhpC